MVTLKEIEAALTEKNYTEADYLHAQWCTDRDIEYTSAGYPPPAIMRYIERLEAQAKPLTWTTEKPKKPGWYWWRRKAFKTRIIEFDEDMWVKMGIEDMHVDELDGEWSSEPIAEPEEAS